ncbi:protein-N(5)-glutamine methyltransferase PrmC, methylates polypeptide chain release factors RF1 and RF2 [Lachnospiraceae bacterium KM106-2]|nr:protein-N(5)-glutamine methyltransferase PrmC, methylates polypeptide chain release factors RF1 and RF2 [Lachnospiraceae bacterium KM106-2]
MKTLETIYAFGRQELRAAKIEEADLDAWYLLEHVTGVTRASYYVNPGRELTEDEVQNYQAGIQKRAARIPLQHIIGKTEFMGLDFFVNENVLVPRQDTEVLVEHVMSRADGKDILDLCTGSGCIIISLAKLCHIKSATAVDISEKALEVAKRNVANQEVNVTLIQSDLFEKVEGKFDVIVSNPPYIPTKDIEELMPEVKDHEPMLALDGMEDGLYFYRKIVDQAEQYLKPCGEIFMEIGYDQGEDLIQLLEQKKFTNVKVFKDLAGLDRVVYGKLQA